MACLVLNGQFRCCDITPLPAPRTRNVYLRTSATSHRQHHHLRSPCHSASESVTSCFSRARSPNYAPRSTTPQPTNKPCSSISQRYGSSCPVSPSTSPLHRQLSTHNPQHQTSYSAASRCSQILIKSSRSTSTAAPLTKQRWARARRSSVSLYKRAEFMQILDNLRDRLALLQALQKVWESGPVRLVTVAELDSPVHLIDALDRHHVCYVDACATWDVRMRPASHRGHGLILYSGWSNSWPSASATRSAAAGWRLGNIASRTKQRGMWSPRATGKTESNRGWWSPWPWFCTRHAPEVITTGPGARCNMPDRARQI